jgi:ribosome recycling factor
LTEERRVELTKQVKSEEEQAKVSVRNIRRDSIHDLKECLNEKMISEDDCHKGQSDVQTITDQMIQNIETLSSGKQKELILMTHLMAQV